MKKLTALLLALSLTLMLLAGCSKDDPGQNNDAARDDVVVRASMMIDNYNPVDYVSDSQGLLFESVFSMLVRTEFDENGKASLVGDLAESWETESDGAVWVFHLNENARFTNGEPVTAEDVKFSLEQCMASAYTSYKVDLIESIEVRDEHTVAINIGSYNARAPWCWRQVAIVNAKAYQADPEAYFENPIGSGAYKLETLDKTTGNYTLVRNDDYYGTPANIRTVSVRVIGDNNNAIIALQNGEVDYMYFSGGLYDLVKDDKSIATLQQPSGYGKWLMLNPNVEPLNNKYLRQAIGYAINYDAQVQLGYGGYAAADNTSFMYSAFSDPQPEGVAKYTYDPEKAKELIAQSGLSTPIDLGDIYGGSGGAAELVQQNLADVGITVQPVSLESYAMVEAYLKGNYSIGIMGGIGGGFYVGADALYSMYGTGQGNNLAQYSNPEVDAMLIELMGTQDKTNYDAKLKEAMLKIVDDAGSFNLGRGAMFSAYNKNLKVPVCDSGLVHFADLSW